MGLKFLATLTFVALTLSVPQKAQDSPQEHATNIENSLHRHGEEPSRNMANRRRIIPDDQDPTPPLSALLRKDFHHHLSAMSLSNMSPREVFALALTTALMVESTVLHAANPEISFHTGT